VVSSHSERFSEYNIPMIIPKRILEQSLGKIKSFVILLLELKNRLRHRFGFGGSGITKELKDWIWQNIQKGETVVELGAGLVSTRILSKRYNLISVEDNSDYVGLYSKALYIHSEIDPNTQWYSLKSEQLPTEFELLIIDGPSGSHLRSNILQCDWIIERTDTIIVDDTWRASEKLLAESIRAKVNGTLVHYSAFSVVRTIKARNT
jgi:hypothetical protein